MRRSFENRCSKGTIDNKKDDQGSQGGRPRVPYQGQEGAEIKKKKYKEGQRGPPHTYALK